MAETNTNETEEKVSRNYIYKTFGIARKKDTSNHVYSLFSASGEHRVGCYVNIGEYGAYLEISDKRHTINGNTFSTSEIRGANFALELHCYKDGDTYEYWLYTEATDASASLRFNLSYGTPDFSEIIYNTLADNILYNTTEAEGESFVCSDVLPGKVWASEGLVATVTANDIVIDIEKNDSIDDDLEFVKNVKKIVESMTYTGSVKVE